MKMGYVIDFNYYNNQALSTKKMFKFFKVNEFGGSFVEKFTRKNMAIYSKLLNQ